MASNNSTAKTHVSLRLPTYLLESIDAHAERESISRTEAFVHYLQTGLEISDEKANEPSADEALLQSIQAELADIKALLMSGGTNMPASAAAPSSTSSAATAAVEEDTMVPVSLTSEEEAEAQADEDYSTSDAVYEGAVEVEKTEVTTEPSFAEGAEDETAALFDASDAVASPDEMPVEEVAPVASAPVSNVFSPNYQPAAAIESEDEDEVDVEEEPMETLSNYYEETAAAAEEEAEEDFGDSDALIEETDAEEVVEETVEEEVVVETSPNPFVSSSYFSSSDDEDEEETDGDEAEEDVDDFSDSNAVFENVSEVEDDSSFEDDELEEELDEFDASDEEIDPEDIDDEEDEVDEVDVPTFSFFSTSDAVEVEDDETDKLDEVEDESDFDDSDEVVEVEDTFYSAYSTEGMDSYSHDEAANLDLSVGSAVSEDSDEDELDIEEAVYVEPLALTDLEDAVSLVAQQFPMIEKVWLFGNAATGGAIEQDTIDLCVKADKFKSKYADLFVSMIEDNTGKTVNVVLRSEMEKSVKQVWKATRIDLYRA